MASHRRQPDRQWRHPFVRMRRGPARQWPAAADGKPDRCRHRGLDQRNRCGAAGRRLDARSIGRPHRGQALRRRWIRRPACAADGRHDRDQAQRRRAEHAECTRRRRGAVERLDHCRCLGQRVRHRVRRRPGQRRGRRQSRHDRRRPDGGRHRHCRVVAVLQRDRGSGQLLAQRHRLSCDRHRTRCDRRTSRHQGDRCRLGDAVPHRDEDAVRHGHAFQ